MRPLPNLFYFLRPVKVACESLGSRLLRHSSGPASSILLVVAAAFMTASAGCNADVNTAPDVSQLEAASGFEPSDSEPLGEGPEADPSEIDLRNRTIVHVLIAPLSFEDYSQTADDVVRGVVRSSNAHCGGAFGSTEYVVDVLEAAHGADGEIRIHVAGTESPDCPTTVMGAPELAADAEVVLFLSRNDDGSYGILGLDQGTYAVAADHAIAGIHADVGESVDHFMNRVRAGIAQ